MKTMSDWIEGGYIPPLQEIGKESGLPVAQWKKAENGTRTLPVILNDADWVGVEDTALMQKGLHLVTVYSGNKEFVGKSVRDKTFIVYNLGENGLSPVSHKHIARPNKIKEVSLTMSEQNNGGNNASDAAMQELLDLEQSMPGAGGNAGAGADAGAGASAGAGSQSMQTFNEGAGGSTPDPEETEEQREKRIIREQQEKARQGLTSDLSKIQLPDESGVLAFNQLHGRFVAVLTGTDERFDVTTADIIRRDENGKSTLKAGRDKEVEAAHAADRSVDKKHLVTDKGLKFRHVKPSPVKGVVLTIPAGGYVDAVAFRTPNELNRVPFDDKNKDLLTQIWTKTEYPMILEMYFGGVIKEDERTHGGEKAATITQLGEVKFETVEGNPVGVPQIRRKLVTVGRRGLVTKTNFLPIKVYKTIEVSSRNTPEEIETLNMSAFIQLTRQKVSKEVGAETKLAALRQEDADLITYDAENDKITSKFFVAGSKDFESIEVPTFWNKEENLSVINVPVRERVEPAEGSDKGVRFPFVTYDATNPKHLTDSAVSPLLSINAPRFKHIMDAANGAITPESLRALSGRTTSGPKGTVLTTRQLIAAQTQALQGSGNMSGEVRFADTKSEDIQKLQSKIQIQRINAGL